MNDSPKPHIMIVEARFYEDIADELAKGAVAAIEQAGGTYERFAVPGAFELPGAIQIAIKSMEVRATARRRFDGYVALGCVIRGETSHYDHVCTESIRGLQDLVLRHTLALGMGIITCENRDQAWTRASPQKGDIGGRAARACLRMLEVKRHFHIWPR
jgi:6,7-dimethyl-8-ribityllumazine synthase